MEPLAFVLASLTLLATPGPTNTLLLTSGAASGLRRSLPLLAAELAGYLLAIVLLRQALGGVLRSVPVLETVLQGLVAAYLLWLAVKLWRRGAAGPVGTAAVTARQVFLTTLLNPKAIIFAFTLLPAETDLVALLPWLGALAVLIVAVGALWISAGVGARRGIAGRVPGGAGYRASACLMLVFAGLMGARVLGLS